ncbi:MAG: hypothetical protein JRI23_07725 [Deltaproteobacteria bacterium]|jgi:hypothetical protein|nr:hypothetical protein [Deltaproteobacteria bacterium]MBW2531494.1 hypothetical protein [Deltaproteobacteria bacterium]
MAVGLGLVSVGTLVYELTQIRVFAYSLHPVIAYAAIALAMLGFGLGATWLTLRPPAVDRDPSGWLAVRSLALAGSMLLANALFARVSPRVIPPRTMEVDLGFTALALLPCIVPYFFAGLITARILQHRIARIGRTYFYNLAGSGLGCALSVLLLRPLGAERIVGASAALAALAAWVFMRQRPGTLRQNCLAGVAAAIALVPMAPRIMPFSPDSNDLIYAQSADGAGPIEVEFAEWDPVGRIDVVRHPAPAVLVAEPVEYRTITNDSGAMSLLLSPPDQRPWGAAIFEQSLYSVPYRLRPKPKVLVIGVGGGIDVLTALHWKAPHVTAVEVSQSTIHALTGPYAEFAEWPLQTDRVRLIHADGRAFARSTAEKFDLVQMSGVDTFTMHSASAMVTAEDYLYTTEALVDFIDLLEPEGVLAVTRFGDEAMNLASVAAAALRRLGVNRPDLHIAAVEQGFAAGIVVKRTPLTEGDRVVLGAIELRQHPTGLRIPHYDAAGLTGAAPLRLLHPKGTRPEPRYQRFFAAMSDGQEVEAQRELGMPFVPPTDDRPYYMLTTLLATGSSEHPVIRALVRSSQIIALSSLLLIALPWLTIRRRQGPGAGKVARLLLYFFALGVCFMLLEVGLIHRTIVFVGSPGAAVGVVIASILLASGLGSRASDRTRWSRRRRLWVAAGGISGVGLLYLIGLAPLLDALFFLPTWARLVVTAGVLAPIGFFAGWFFPVGLGMLRGEAASLVPWAIAINGFASVIGSLITLPLSVALGFRAVFAIAIGGYLIATLAFTLGSSWRREHA